MVVQRSESVCSLLTGTKEVFYNPSGSLTDNPIYYTECMSKNRTFVVHEAQVEDVGKGIGRIHPQDMADIDLAADDVIEVIGSNKTVTKVMPMAESHPYRKIIQIDGITRENAGVGPDDFVEIKKRTSIRRRPSLFPRLTLPDPFHSNTRHSN